MRFPVACYQVLTLLEDHFSSCLRPAQRRWLACWVTGTILAKSACQSSVVAALLPLLGQSANTVRQYLREGLYDGQDKAAPCHTEIVLAACFVPLMRWVLSLWRGKQLALAIDVTNQRDRLHVLCISVLYRSSAIPVAWQIMPGNQKGAWLPHLCRLLRLLGAVIPPEFEVLVLMDAGLRSPGLWQAVREQGWHPVQRHEQGLWFRPAGWHHFHPAASLVPEAGHAWMGRGAAFKSRQSRCPATLVVVWQEGQSEPWVLLTDLEPEEMGLCWYGLRVWIELGFRALKGLGWQWQQSQRRDPDRVGRHWLVLAVATCIVLATGTRVEDAAAVGMPPSRLHHPPAAGARRTGGRLLSVFLLGVTALQQQLWRKCRWRRLWLIPEPWPDDAPTLVLARHRPPPCLVPAP